MTAGTRYRAPVIMIIIMAFTTVLRPENTSQHTLFFAVYFSRLC